MGSPDMFTDGNQLRSIPYLARQYEVADDIEFHSGLDYYDNNIVGTIQDGDVVVSPVKSKESCDPEHAKDHKDCVVFWASFWMHAIGVLNKKDQDKRIIYERHYTPMLHILDVKLQYGSEDDVKYSWKLDEATKECKLEIDQSDKDVQGKKTVNFSFPFNDTDKLLSQVVDGYEVKYMLRTDAIRLRLELEIVLSTPDTIADFNTVHGNINLEIQRDGKPYTIYLLHDQPPSKKPKLDHSNNTFKLSFVGIVPRNLYPDTAKLTVALKDSTSTLDIDTFHLVCSWNTLVDQQDYIHFKNGYLRFNVFRGCCVRKGKGICTGICTCEPGEFVAFPNLIKAVAAPMKNNLLMRFFQNLSFATLRSLFLFKSVKAYEE